MVQNTNRYTVITGASSEIGYETAKAFAGRGSNLILVARRKDRLEKMLFQRIADTIFGAENKYHGFGLKRSCCYHEERKNKSLHL